VLTEPSADIERNRTLTEVDDRTRRSRQRGR
jgi:hypothetical protein